MQNQFSANQKSSNPILTCLCYLLLLTILNGCVDVRDHQDAPPAPETATVINQAPKAVADKNSDLPVTIIANEAPNKYSVRLAVPTGATSIHRRLLTQDQTRNKMVSLIIDTGLHAFTDVEVEADSKYMYSFSKVIDGQNQFLTEFQVDIPKDLVLAANYVFAGDKADVKLEGYERVFLQNNVVLTTWGRNVTISGNILIADNATIQTFPVNRTASPPESNGRHGGNLNLSFKKASGQLRIEMRGENGADGPAIPDFSSRAAGTMGSYGLGPYCQPLVGDAESGKDGRQGNNGGNGGSSGFARINIDDMTNLTVDHLSKGGVRGQFGPGGNGQLGGLIGPGCHGEVNGIPGANGKKGSDGASGQDGTSIPVCFNTKNGCAAY